MKWNLLNYKNILLFKFKKICHMLMANIHITYFAVLLIDFLSFVFGQIHSSYIEKSLLKTLVRQLISTYLPIFEDMFVCVWVKSLPSTNIQKCINIKQKANLKSKSNFYDGRIKYFKTL